MDRIQRNTAQIKISTKHSLCVPCVIHFGHGSTKPMGPKSRPLYPVPSHQGHGVSQESTKNRTELRSFLDICCYSFPKLWREIQAAKQLSAF